MTFLYYCNIKITSKKLFLNREFYLNMSFVFCVKLLDLFYGYLILYTFINISEHLNDGYIVIFKNDKHRAVHILRFYLN